MDAVRALQAGARRPRLTRRFAAAGAALLALAGVAVAAPALVLPADLPDPERARLRSVTDRATITGQVQGEGFVLRGDVFEFLLDHPELASHVARTLEIGRYRVRREADGLWLDDGRGSVGRFEVVYAGPGTRVAHLRGTYQPRYLPSIRGEAVAVFEYVATPAPGARLHITPALTGFIRLDNPVIALASRLLHDVATARAERIARRFVDDVARTARALEAEPARVLEELRRRPDAPAREVEEFAQLLTRD